MAETPLAEYRIKPKIIQGSRRSALGCTVVGFLFVAVGVVFAIADQSLSPLNYLIVIGLLMWVGAWVAYRFEWMREQRKFMQIYSEGVRYCDGRREPRMFTWEQLKWLIKSQSTLKVRDKENPPHSWLLTTQQDEVIKLIPEMWENMNEMIAHFRNGLLTTHLGGYIEQINAGEVVRFGRFGIGRLGVYIEDEFTLWHRVTGVRYDSDDPRRIEIREDGKWRFWASTANFPNYFVWLQLVEPAGGVLQKLD